MTVIYKATILNPISEEQCDILENGYLVVNEKGTIDALTKSDPKERYPGAQLQDLEGKMIIPGFIDTHVHLPQFSFGGIGDLELMEWLQKYTFPEERKFSDTAYARNIAEHFFGSLVEHGTTTACVYATIHEGATNAAFEVANRVGIRAYIGKVMMDAGNIEGLTEDPKESLDAAIRLFERWDGADNGRLNYVFTPRFAPTSTEKSLKEIGDAAKKRNAAIQTHLSESPGEIALVRKLFGGREYTQVYGDAGLLGPRTVMGHAIHLSETELQQLIESDTKIAHCPYSNKFLQSGFMPYREWRNRGLTIGLGTDVAGGPSISMKTQMREAIGMSKIVWMATRDYVRRDSLPNLIRKFVEGKDEVREGDLPSTISPTEALYLATLAGAKVLCCDDRTGNLLPGKDADFLIVNPQATQNVPGNGYASPQETLSRLIYIGGRRSIEGTFVRGKKLGILTQYELG